MTLAAIYCGDPRSLANHEVFALEVGDVVLGNVVPQGVKQLGDSDFSAGGHLAPFGGVELDEPPVALRVEDRETRRDAVALTRRDRPLAWGRTGRRVGPFGDFLNGHRPATDDPVREP